MGLLIVLEGSDGTGKSTQARLLYEDLSNRGMRVTQTREPGGTELGDTVREVVMGKTAPAMTPLATAFLMNASRAELVSQVVHPSLESEDVVVLDRFWYSTLAYQGSGDGLDWTKLMPLCEVASGGTRPDMVFLLDMPAHEALRRRRSSRTRNLLDSKPVDYYRRVRQAYLDMAAADPVHWTTVDAGLPEEVVSRDIRDTVLKLLNRDGRA